MDRLTTKVEGNVYYSKGKYENTTLCAEMETRDVRACMKRLAEYEDIGLMPNDIKKYIEKLKEAHFALKIMAEFNNSTGHVLMIIDEIDKLPLAEQRSEDVGN